MKNNYQYPFDIDWSKQEIVDVINFFTLVEKAYEKGVERDLMLAAYRTFKTIVPSKSEEKQYFKDFEEQSGYSSYHVVKKAKDSENKLIKM